MDVLIQFVIDNWAVWFSGGAFALVGWFSGLFRWLFRLFFKKPAPVPTVDLNGIAKRLAETSKQLGAAEEREQRYRETIRELTSAVEALAEEREKADAPPGIDAALKQLAEGETKAAESIFEQVLEQKKAEGEGAYKEAAAAARHLGALAFLHDTQKALSAYVQAVELDPENPHGWNVLGLLQDRLGNLDSAIKAFERVLALGNKADDKAVVAAAYGNLGLVYETRRDLAKAEEYHRKSLAIEKGLGRKEGMANQYGNLGNVYQARGDLAKAEEYFLKSLALDEELGRKEGVAKTYGNLGLVYETRGDLAKAEEYHRKSLAIEKGLGRKEGMASQYGNLGLVYKTRGDLAKAEEYFLKALAIEEELGRKEGMANQYGNLGNVYQARGDLAKACEAWAKSRRLFEELGAPDRAEKVRALMEEAGCG